MDRAVSRATRLEFDVRSHEAAHVGDVRQVLRRTRHEPWCRYGFARQRDVADRIEWFGSYDDHRAGGEEQRRREDGNLAASKERSGHH
jgi:hypothetical protein